MVLEERGLFCCTASHEVEHHDCHDKIAERRREKIGKKRKRQEKQMEKMVYLY